MNLHKTHFIFIWWNTIKPLFYTTWKRNNGVSNKSTSWIIIHNELEAYIAITWFKGCNQLVQCIFCVISVGWEKIQNKALKLSDSLVTPMDPLQILNINNKQYVNAYTIVI